MSEIEGMSHEDAVAALTEAAAAEGETAIQEQAPAPVAPPAPAPVEGAPVDETQVPGQAGDVEDVADEQPTDEDFVPFNPDELPPELVPAWKQLQQAWTPKLQEAAVIRKQFEELGGQETVQQAVELQHWMSDPANWPALYEQVYQMMEQAGFEFEDETPGAAPSAPVAPDFSEMDPDIAPLASELEQLRQQTTQQQQLMESFVQQQQHQQQMAQEELRQAQILADLQRQVVGIRQANPHYTDDDVRAIVELGTFYNDDLMRAQQRYEAIVADRLTRYLSGKATPAPAGVSPQSGAGVQSTETVMPQTLREAEEEAVEYMRQLQAAGELDL